ncbi:DUF1758 domain-containing protein [Trichonephila clavipes]|nr:DUF1758 domain-containing protein [Trichonephila clavipes]
MKSKACLNQKKAIISSLTRLKNKTLQDINELDSTELKIRKNRFDVIGEELKTLFDNLFSLANDDEIEGYILEKQELLDTWEEMLILLERRVSHLNKTNKSTELDSTTRGWWERSLDNENIPSLSELLQFLSNHARSLMTEGFDSNSQVLLCTALVNVCDSFGGTRLCRVLLDPGSQACLITSSCLERLGLPRKQTNVRISCLGASDTRTNGISEIKFTPHFTSNISFVTSVYVVNKIVGQLPHFSLDSSWSEPFSDLKLADPTFFKSGLIDILIGVNIALPMLKGQSLSLGDNKPFAVRSDLGWIVAGNVPSEDMFSSIAVNSIRNEDGRYVVRLPFHSSPSKLGGSRESAIRRFKSLEHSLIKKPVIYSQYRDFMQEYLTSGHMELVPKNDYAKKGSILSSSSRGSTRFSTTKLRVVFDASAKSTSGTFQIAVCADLEKMFRQIRISSEDTNWQRILWRDNPKETVKEYRLTTVTYGASCAPYPSLEP